MSVNTPAAPEKINGNGTLLDNLRKESELIESIDRSSEKSKLVSLGSNVLNLEKGKPKYGDSKIDKEIKAASSPSLMDGSPLPPSGTLSKGSSIGNGASRSSLAASSLFSSANDLNGEETEASSDEMSSGDLGSMCKCVWKGCKVACPTEDLIMHISLNHVRSGKDAYECGIRRCKQSNGGVPKVFDRRVDIMKHIRGHPEIRANGGVLTPSGKRNSISDTLNTDGKVGSIDIINKKKERALEMTITARPIKKARTGVKFDTYDLVFCNTKDYGWWPGQIMYPFDYPDMLKDPASVPEGSILILMFCKTELRWVPENDLLHYESNRKNRLVAFDAKTSAASESDFWAATSQALEMLSKAKRISSKEFCVKASII
eukprot:Nk52_evm24s352 gene=Nk52_evmTU24s352